MNLSDFRKLHFDGKIILPRGYENNPLPSNTDPTQDVPIENVQLAANGIPINVSLRKDLVMTNSPIEKMTAIDRRYMDKFDVVGELQAAERRVKNYKPIND